MTRRTLASVFVFALVAPARAAAPEHDAVVRGAIERVVAERMGERAAVRIERLEAGLREVPAALRAVPPPGARTGRLVSFALFEGTQRVGTATALVKVSLPHVRFVVAVARDTALEAGHVAVVDSDLDGVRFGRVPELAEVVGSVVRRDVVAGEPLTHAVVAVAPAVRSGDEVEVLARIGDVEARGIGRASGSGHVGARVRVSSAGKKTLWPARVVSPGVVELLGPRDRASRGESE